MTSEAARTSRPPVSPSWLGPADEHDGDAELVGRLAGAGDDLVRAPCRRPWRRPRRAASAGLALQSLDVDGLAAAVPAAVRAHDVGQLGRRHCGQTLRGGALSRQADARRLRLFAFEVFFLGTAMGLPRSV